MKICVRRKESCELRLVLKRCKEIQRKRKLPTSNRGVLVFRVSFLNNGSFDRVLSRGQTCQFVFELQEDHCTAERHSIFSYHPPALFVSGLWGGLQASVYSHPKTFGIIMDTYCQDSPWNLITCLHKFDLPGSSFKLSRAVWQPSALLWRGLFLIKENIPYLLTIMELILFGL